MPISAFWLAFSNFVAAFFHPLCVYILETRWACPCRLGGNLDPGMGFFGVAPASFLC